MQLLPILPDQQVVGGLLNQRVPEEILHLRPRLGEAERPENSSALRWLMRVIVFDEEIAGKTTFK